jgi:hypothetical protein
MYNSRIESKDSRGMRAGESGFGGVNLLNTYMTGSCKGGSFSQPTLSIWTG